MSSPVAKGAEVSSEGAIDLPYQVAFQAADNLFLRLALYGAALEVGPSPRAVAETNDNGHVQGAVRAAVAAVVQPMSDGASR